MNPTNDTLKNHHGAENIAVFLFVFFVWALKGQDKRNHQLIM